MPMVRWFGFAVLCSALSACNCGNPNGNDGGSGGGTGGNGGSGGNGGAGGGGSSIPGIDLADFCSTAVTGLKDVVFREEATCGTPLTQADADHIAYQGFATRAEAYGGSDCNDGGLSDQMKKYRDAVAAGRLEYNAPKALECQSKGRATKNDGGFPFKAFDGKLVDPCSQIWTPKVALNGACEADYECMGDNYCKPTSASGCGGTCSARLPLGSSCTTIRSECNQDGFCAKADGGSFQCLAYLGAGDQCGATGQPRCRPDTTCIGDSATGGTDTCLPFSRVGEPCKSWDGVGNNCGEGVCVSDAGNVPGALGTCLQAPTVGQRCGTGFDGYGQCDYCSACDTDAGTPTCLAWGKTGWGCQGDSDCLNAYYFCSLPSDGGFDGTCALKPRVGETCVVDFDGDYGNCMYVDNWCKKNMAGSSAVPGVCTPYPALNQACGERFDLTATCPAASYCKGDTDAGVGVCSPLALRDQRCTTDTITVTQIASDCSAAADYCDIRPDAGGDGLYDGICHPRSGSNAFCSDEVLCLAGLNCVPYAAPTDGGVQKCVPPLQNGVGCGRNAECQSDWCKADAGMTCAALIGSGLPCLRNAECDTGVCDPQSLVCVAYCGVIANETNFLGSSTCMHYDLNSMSGYIFFSIVLVPLFSLRRKHKAAARK